MGTTAENLSTIPVVLYKAPHTNGFYWDHQLFSNFKKNQKNYDKIQMTWNKLDLELDDVASLDDARRPSHALAPELQLPVDGRHSTASAAVDVDAL